MINDITILERIIDVPNITGELLFRRLREHGYFGQDIIPNESIYNKIKSESGREVYSATFSNSSRLPLASYLNFLEELAKEDVPARFDYLIPEKVRYSSGLSILDKQFEGVQIKDYFYTASYSLNDFNVPRHETTYIIKGEELDLPVDILIGNGNGMLEREPSIKAVIEQSILTGEVLKTGNPLEKYTALCTLPLKKDVYDAADARFKLTEEHNRIQDMFRRARANNVGGMFGLLGQ